MACFTGPTCIWHCARLALRPVMLGIWRIAGSFLLVGSQLVSTQAHPTAYSKE